MPGFETGTSQWDECIQPLCHAAQTLSPTLTLFRDMAGIEVYFKTFEFTRHRMYQTGIDDFLCEFTSTSINLSSTLFLTYVKRVCPYYPKGLHARNLIASPNHKTYVWLKLYLNLSSKTYFWNALDKEIFSSSQIRTRDSWLRSANALTLCPSPLWRQHNERQAEFRPLWEIWTHPCW